MFWWVCFFCDVYIGFGAWFMCLGVQLDCYGLLGFGVVVGVWFGFLVWDFFGGGASLCVVYFGFVVGWGFWLSSGVIGYQVWFFFWFIFVLCCGGMWFGWVDFCGILVLVLVFLGLGIIDRFFIVGFLFFAVVLFGGGVLGGWVWIGCCCNCVLGCNFVF